jgi:hypothetical protein
VTVVVQLRVNKSRDRNTRTRVRIGTRSTEGDEVRLRRLAWSACRVKISNSVIINFSHYL